MIWYRLCPFFLPYKGWLSFGVLASLTNVTADIFIIYCIQRLVSTSIYKNSSSYAIFVLLILGSLALGTFSKYIIRYSAGRFSAYVMEDVRKLITSHIARLPVLFLESRPQGDLLSRLSSDTYELQDFLENHLFSMIYQPLILISAFIYMVAISPLLTFWICLIIVIMVILSTFISRPMGKYAKSVQQQIGKVNGIIQDVIYGISLVKVFDLVETFYLKFQKVVNEGLEASLQMIRHKTLIRGVNVAVQLVPFTTCILYGAWMTTNNEIQVSELLVFIYLLNYLVNPATIIQNLLGHFQGTKVAVNRLFELLDQPLERSNGMKVEVLTSFPAIEFKNVTFGYEPSSCVIVNNSFQLNSNKLVAIVGPSGGGKSTIFKLLCGFYQPREGDIHIFGQKLSECDLLSVRQNLAWVSQDALLLPGTIEENIAITRPGALIDDIISAAHLSNADSFIQQLPNGYETYIEENGKNLSGGQRQRLAIARAVMKQAPILLLDEPTSALDCESEAEIGRTIELLKERHSILVIAHRLSTIQYADEVLVLDKGKIVARGTHQELIRKEGLYKEWVTQQKCTT
jgi:subfamily B ATP-binding cassette protein MsbA/ATP-binding cassette subfamily B protein AbcA/BmrA